MAKAMFGAGCFWGVESAFRGVKGVTDVAVGYAGGTTENPSYEEVCRGATGHAEVVEVEFDEARVGYDDLLKVFFQIHDPTQMNRQGPDVGSQYRSAIFFHTPEQESAAKESMSEQQALLGDKPIVTEITAAPMFYVAEDYHQQYLEKRGLATCRIG